MKKATKKLLTLALSTLFVGAGIGGTIAAYDTYNATVASAAIADMTQVDTAIDCAMPLEEKKVKNISSWGYYDSDADGVGDVWAFKGDGTAGGQPEIRFSTPGTNTSNDSAERIYKPMTVNKITVEYNITNSGTEKAELSETPYMLQILGATEGTGSTNCYYNHFPEIIADGQWHTLTIDLNSVFSGGKEGLPTAATFDDINELVCCFNFKIGKDFNGEAMFRNFQVDRPLVIVDSKIKNYDNYGLEDGVWTFNANNDKTNHEIRFATAESANPANKVYTAVPLDSFSFDYKIENSSDGQVGDLKCDANYLVQELAADATYPLMLPEIIADGQWHTLTIDKSTPLVNNEGVQTGTFGDQSYQFAGFILKIGKLTGSVSIKNINFVREGAEVVEPFVDLSGEMYCMNQHGGSAWDDRGDYKEAGLYRFWVDEDKAIDWIEGSAC